MLSASIYASAVAVHPIAVVPLGCCGAALPPPIHTPRVPGLPNTARDRVPITHSVRTITILQRRPFARFRTHYRPHTPHKYRSDRSKCTAATVALCRLASLRDRTTANHIHTVSEDCLLLCCRRKMCGLSNRLSRAASLRSPRKKFEVAGRSACKRLP